MLHASPWCMHCHKANLSLRPLFCVHCSAGEPALAAGSLIYVSNPAAQFPIQQTC